MLTISLLMFWYTSSNDTIHRQSLQVTLQLTAFHFKWSKTHITTQCFSFQVIPNLTGYHFSIQSINQVQSPQWMLSAMDLPHLQYLALALQSLLLILGDPKTLDSHFSALKLTVLIVCDSTIASFTFLVIQQFTGSHYKWLNNSQVLIVSESTSHRFSL